MGFDGVGSMEPIRAMRKRATRCLAIAQKLADDDGEVIGGQPRLRAALGVSSRHLRRALADLEDSGLALRVGVDRVIVSMGQVRIGPPSSSKDPTESVRNDPEWRSLRAQLGGKSRALVEVAGQRDEARAALAALEKETRRQSRLGVSPDVVALRADLEHSADCGDPDCDRCLAIVQRIEEDRPRYAREDELVERLECGALLERATRVLMEAQATRDTEARRRGQLAALAMRAVVGGERGEAARLLHEAERT